MALSSEQFGQVLKNTLAGGDSVNVVTGERPSKGYMVSDDGSEARVKAENMGVDKLARHASRHHDVLHNDPSAHLGTWRDAQYTDEGRMIPRPTDTVYLDVSRRYPNLFLAQLAGQRENQMAVYGVHEGQSYDVAREPLRTERAKRRAVSNVERMMG